ncbi:hypothetical protein QFZ66_006618 [Streptomyces sp. B4I13]|uniref:hypothetical protein n=1 Tax=Streptomyces sp. B4I13 TaxID=3042271 RepID=UPI00278042D7|nr:hypothetical protein [Streptomyces sp. B4I13]MDQ0962740.1 hypothetical protein [Streptomyces sp. B4I13]
MQIKRAKRRTAMLAAFTVAAGALFTVMVPGIAEAQSGSRICGNWWAGYYNGGQNEVIWSRVIEVPKSDGISCSKAMARTDKVGNPPLPSRITRYNDLHWGARQRLDNVTCEWFSQELLNAKHGDDVCLKMLRADNVQQVKLRTISQFWVDN